MQTRPLPSTPDARSPAGAEIRHLIEGETGGLIHSTVPPGQVNRATVHATVSEFWHVLSGEGQIWRRACCRGEDDVSDFAPSLPWFAAAIRNVERPPPPTSQSISRRRLGWARLSKKRIHAK